eukprot:5120201-Pleurochrysis_carterae.AAC.1
MRLTSGKTDSSNLTSLKRTLCSEPNGVEQVDEVAAAALVDAEMNTFCNMRCELAKLLCFSA